MARDIVILHQMPVVLVVLVAEALVAIPEADKTLGAVPVVQVILPLQPQVKAMAAVLVVGLLGGTTMLRLVAVELAKQAETARHTAQGASVVLVVPVLLRDLA